MRSWSMDWLLQRTGWKDELETKGRQRKLGSHLVHLFRQAISTNVLLPGDRLPSARDLMKELGISRNTASYVYEQLCIEGYVVARVGSGTYVAMLTPAMVHRAPLAAHENAPEDVNSVQISVRAQQVLDSRGAGPRQWGAFMPGIPDVRAFPRAAYAHIINRLWRHAQPELLTYGSSGGALPLKSALVDYLRLGRGVRCRPEQVLITEGAHQALDLTLRTLVDPQDAIWMEDPGYWGMVNLARMHHDANIVWREIDDEGLCIDPRAPAPKLIYTTPSHQYPGGTVMSLNRRKELIAYARSHRSWIIEDDYDSEFRFGGRHVPAMQGIDNNVPVIYVGTFSKTLFPGLRVGYMVLPEVLVEPMTRMQAELYRQGHLVTQMALAQFIREGHYTKHIRKMRVTYGRRREWLKTLITRHLGTAYLPEVDSHAGLHLILRLPDHLDDEEITRQLHENGVLAKPLSKYYHARKPSQGLLLGYAAVEEHEIQKAFFDMLKVLKRNGL